jgi:hypothetical protein
MILARFIGKKNWQNGRTRSPASHRNMLPRYRCKLPSVDEDDHADPAIISVRPWRLSRLPRRRLIDADAAMDWMNLLHSAGSRRGSPLCHSIYRAAAQRCERGHLRLSTGAQLRLLRTQQIRSAFIAKSSPDHGMKPLIRAGRYWNSHVQCRAQPDCSILDGNAAARLFARQNDRAAPAASLRRLRAKGLFTINHVVVDFRRLSYFYGSAR